MPKRLLRSISLAASLGGALLNVGLAVKVLASSRSLRWDLDSEADALRVDAVKLVWGLLALYFAAAATASTIGFVGIARNKLSYVRFFRDYSIADFMFMLVSAVGVSYASFSSVTLKSEVCEELGRQPELMRDMAESGLNLENCEYWFERAVVAVLGIILVFVVVRLHFVIALSKYHSQLRRDHQGPGGRYIHGSGVRTSQATKIDSMQRIYLLPTPTSPTSMSFNHHKTSSDSSSVEDVVVYAPVPLGRLSVDEAKGMHATEAWIPTPTTATSFGSSKERSHRHHHRHHSHSAVAAGAGGRVHRHRRRSVSVLSPYRDEVTEPLLEEKEEDVMV